MSPVTSTAATFVLNLSEPEREFLLRVLENALHDKQIEVHRTDAIDYKVHLEREEDILQSLVGQLRRA